MRGHSPDPVGGPDTHPWLVRTAQSVTLNLYVQPGAACTQVSGTHGERLKIRVAAPAVENRANRALVRFLAGAFGVPPTAVELVAGSSQREKRVRVHGPRIAPDWLPD